MWKTDAPYESGLYFACDERGALVVTAIVASNGTMSVQAPQRIVVRKGVPYMSRQAVGGDWLVRHGEGRGLVWGPRVRVLQTTREHYERELSASNARHRAKRGDTERERVA